MGAQHVPHLGIKEGRDSLSISNCTGTVGSEAPSSLGASVLLPAV